MPSARAGPRRTLEGLSATFDSLPIRTRLAGVSALLTFVILCAFALTIGSLTVHRIRNDFNREVADTASQLPSEMTVTANPLAITPSLKFLATQEHAVIRILSLSGNVVAGYPSRAPAFGPPGDQVRSIHGYRVVTRALPVYVVRERLLFPIGHLYLQYGRPIGPTEATVHRVELLLFGGVIIGSVFALFAGMAIARRAMAPIAALTSTAAEIARTRDPSRQVPQPQADDEVSELASTLEGMLRELDAARGETEAALTRQRQFVADASHELRTPLTSVLANLELLAESLHGEQGEAARSALRSSQRMRRLVTDLLLLARTDAKRVLARQRCDLAQIVVEAAAELGPVSSAHEISLEVQPAIVEASRDELHRLTINLIENAIRHTPPGSSILVTTATTGEGVVELVVEDDGPGVPQELAPILFERFVRGSGDRGGSFGLGLAIVYAVAHSHGGSVALEPRAGHGGARFVVRLPARSDLDDDRQHHRTALQAVID